MNYSGNYNNGTLNTLIQATAIIPEGCTANIAGGVTNAKKIIGIVPRQIEVGQTIEILPPGQRGKGLSSAAITAEEWLTGSVSGKLTTAIATDVVVAIAVGSTTAADQEFEIYTVSPFVL